MLPITQTFLSDFVSAYKKTVQWEPGTNKSNRELKSVSQ